MTAIAYARPCCPPDSVPPGVASPVRPVRLVAVRSGRQAPSSPPAALPATVYWRRRVAAALVLATALVVAWAGLGALGVGPLPGPGPSGRAGTVVHVVQPGDTLWSLARRIQPGGDVRPVVDRLIAANGGAVLQVGERLELPART